MTPSIQNVSFLVDETPCCLWDTDIRQRNLDFLDSIDPGYFEHIADLHGESLEGDEKQYAATALRVAYFQGLETLFARSQRTKSWLFMKAMMRKLKLRIRRHNQPSKMAAESSPGREPGDQAPKRFRAHFSGRQKADEFNPP